MQTGERQPGVSPLANDHFFSSEKNWGRRKFPSDRWAATQSRLASRHVHGSCAIEPLGGGPPTI